MRKLNLANLAQNEIQKDEAGKIKGGICICYCACSCPVEYRIDIRIDDKLDGRLYIA